MPEPAAFEIRPIAFVSSTLTRKEDAPMQGFEGAPDAWLELTPEVLPALHGVSAGDELILITWFHEANREALQVHPRDDLSRPLTGVFATRSPDRPNPLGLHRVTVREIDGGRLKVGPLEAIDRTPIVDIKPVLTESDDA
jgi:tRNA-Thr(GGU) m(6)t(6)A37 methyltransferase TsaA